MSKVEIATTIRVDSYRECIERVNSWRKKYVRKCVRVMKFD